MRNFLLRNSRLLQTIIFILVTIGLVLKIITKNQDYGSFTTTGLLLVLYLEIIKLNKTEK